jgi:hypothetical protein
MNDRRAADQATAGLRKNLCEFPARFVKCILVAVQDQYHTATATLLDFGHGPLAVTCSHVITKYLEEWKAGRAIVRIGNIGVAPSQLADLDTDVDLATIRLTAEQAMALVAEEGISTQFYEPPRWPPERAIEKEWVAIGGFPGEWRRRGSEPQALILPYYGIGATAVTSTTERYFSCQFEREHWIWVSRYLELPDLTTFGGLSGGPVFAERRLHRALIGIVTEISQPGEIMFLAHAHWIQKDGSICRDRPWDFRRAE